MRKGKQFKKGNIGHLAMAAAGDRDVIQRVKISKEMNRGQAYCNITPFLS
jgi:hypothetical protein